MTIPRANGRRVEEIGGVEFVVYDPPPPPPALLETSDAIPHHFCTVLGCDREAVIVVAGIHMRHGTPAGGAMLDDHGRDRPRSYCDVCFEAFKDGVRAIVEMGGGLWTR